MFQSTLAVVLVLGLLIAFHELGHFLVARVLKMGVKTFSLGFGPKILGFQRGKTLYKLAAIPLGGYVSLVGEAGEEGGLEDGWSEREHFHLRPAWQRLLVVLAGPVFNLVLAALLYAGLFSAVGYFRQLPVVDKLTPGAPAERSGVLKGDRIVGVNGSPSPYWTDLVELIGKSEGPVVLDIRRGEEIVLISVTPEIGERTTIFGEKERAKLIGITPLDSALEHVPVGLAEATVKGVQKTGEMVWLTLVSFGKLITRVVPLDNVGGPIMIAQAIGKQVHEGMAGLIGMTAFISVSLAVLNLLPIPVLDGGHIFFLTIEMLIGRPVNKRVVENATKVGLAFLIMLMLFAFYNDLARIFSKS